MSEIAGNDDFDDRQSTSDAELTRRFQSGDLGAFDEIDSRYRRGLTRFFYVRVHSNETAEDLTQETMSRAFSGLPGVANGVFFAGWLYRIAYRIFLDWIRRNRRRVTTVSYDEPFSNRADSSDQNFEAEESSRYISALSTTNDDRPEEILTRLELKENIWKTAKRVLTSDEFQTLWLKYAVGSSDKETALALGKTPTAIRATAFRARRKLAESLKRFL